MGLVHTIYWGEKEKETTREKEQKKGEE